MEVHIGPMAQDIQKVWPEQVTEVNGYLVVRGDDLPNGITILDLATPVRPNDKAAIAEATKRWRAVFNHWKRSANKKKNSLAKRIEAAGAMVTS